jgi:hypothetical protein
MTTTPAFYTIDHAANLLNGKLPPVQNAAKNLFVEFYKPTEPVRPWVGSSPKYHHTTIIHNPSPSWWWMFLPSHHTTHVHVDSRTTQERESDRDRQNRFFIGVLALAVGAIASYTLGRELKKLALASQGLEVTRDLQKAVTTEQNNSWQIDCAWYKLNTGPWETQVTAGERLFTEVRNSALVGAALKTAFLASATFALVGAFMASWALIMAGAAVGSITLFATLLRMGYTSGDDKRISDLAQQLMTASYTVATYPSPAPSAPPTATYGPTESSLSSAVPHNYM